MSVEFKWKKYCYIDQFEMVNTFYLGNILRVRQIKNGPAECPIIRLPNNEYKIKTTGEVKKNKKMIKNRSQGESAMKRTRREIRDIITTNCGGDKMKNCMFIVNGKIKCRKSVNLNVGFPTFFNETTLEQKDSY